MEHDAGTHQSVGCRVLSNQIEPYWKEYEYDKKLSHFEIDIIGSIKTTPVQKDTHLHTHTDQALLWDCQPTLSLPNSTH